eukprot:TRINITY_DN3611_c0_g1_i1.p2 TRINITY_DN3611_c0_g1~~TRINITY_DN3611_c0_g1_i1.p2  ORF type:complete len:115 (-),score=32.04 TRINITY_DN3611_c0_g1_i1:238-582(-)
MTTAKKSDLPKWKKAITPGESWEKEELLDAIYWSRQIFSLFVGILWGVLPLTGAMGLSGFFVASVLFVIVYTTKFLGIYEDDFGGRGELVQEGMMPAFAAFMVSWIITYSTLHA